MRKANANREVTGRKMGTESETSQTTEMVEIQEVHQDEVKFCILGDSPLIMHRFPKKAWQELLLPARRLNRASLEQTLKHNPPVEYRESLYRNRDNKRPTLFHVPTGMFHGALAQAAIDIPGAKKAQIERLTRIVDINIDLYGTPYLRMDMVRNSGINRAPDVRTRPCFPEWACQITVRYVRNVITQRTIANLLSAAGLIVGIGDWRGEKGGPFGAFRVVHDDNADFLRIMKQGRKVQQAAYDNPSCLDEDSAELLSWFEKEVNRREQDRGPSTSIKRMKGQRGRNGKVKLPRGTKVVNEDRQGRLQ